MRLDTSGKAADSRMETLLEILTTSDDREALESLFSPNALSEMENLDEQVTSLFEMFENKECTWERTGLTVSDDIEYGKSVKKVVAWYVVSSEEAEFVFFTIDCLEDHDSSDNVGLYTLWIVAKENEDTQLTAWQDMQIPGIHIAVDNSKA